MLGDSFDSLVRVHTLRDHRLRASIVSFAQQLCDLGYERPAARLHIRAAGHFMQWASRRCVPIQSLDETVVDCFYQHMAHCRCPDYGPTSNPRVLCGARMFLSHLRMTGLTTTIAVERAEPVLLVAFRRWMQQQRGTCESTLESYSRPIREFLKCFGEDPSRFDTQSLRQFILERGQQPGGGDVKRCIDALRAFCRFLHAEGYYSNDLSAAIPTIAQWRLSRLPRYLPASDVERVVAACDLDSTVGRRDRAILLLLARLGLRASDIVQLRLADIDWKGGWIVVCGKSRRQTQLPLTQEVGDALAAYIQNGRPQTDAKTVFVRARAPFLALGSHHPVSLMVARAFRRAGVIRPNRGAAHFLRHSLATALLRQGASLQDIADVLRHRSVSTTQIYAKVDVTALQQIAQPWPGTPSC